MFARSLLLRLPLPQLTGKQVVDRIITELGVFDIEPGKGLVMKEIAPGVTEDEVRDKTGCTVHLCPNLKEMTFPETRQK